MREVTSVGGLVGFSTIITFASLSDVGQYSSLSIALRMNNRIFKPGIGSSGIILAVMLSDPGALCGCSRLLTWFISIMVNGDSFSWGLLICANLSSKSGSIVVSCGVKTSVKCLANSAAFSSSVCAHGPGGLVLLRMGGFGTIGFCVI